MDKSLLIIAALFLKRYSRELANRGCSDWEWPCMIKHVDRMMIVTQMLAANRPGLPLEEDDYEMLEQYTYGDDGPPDWWIAGFVADKLAEMAK